MEAITCLVLLPSRTHAGISVLSSGEEEGWEAGFQASPLSVGLVSSDDEEGVREIWPVELLSEGSLLSIVFASNGRSALTLALQLKSSLLTRSSLTFTNVEFALVAAG